MSFNTILFSIQAGRKLYKTCTIYSLIDELFLQQIAVKRALMINSNKTCQ